MGRGREDNEPCILWEAPFEDEAQRDGTRATGREGEETAVCTGGRISRSLGFFIVHFSHISNLER